MIRFLLCAIGLHKWGYRASDNHMRLTRSCAHCPKKQELRRTTLVLESWR